VSRTGSSKPVRPPGGWGVAIGLPLAWDSDAKLDDLREHPRVS
jgi:hypothetical protein